MKLSVYLILGYLTKQTFKGGLKMNFKKQTCKLICAVMTIILTFSINISVYAGSLIPVIPYSGISLSTDFSLAHDVVMGPDGYLYVADYGDDKIYKMDKTGQNITSFCENITGAKAMVFDKDGNLYLAQYINIASAQKLLKITPQGVSSFVNSSFAQPLNGIAIDKDNVLYISDNSGDGVTTGHIYKINLDGSGQSLFADSFDHGQIQGICFDADNNLYVPFLYKDKIAKIDTNGNTTNFITGLSNTTWASMGDDGFLYVSTSNKTIEKFDLNGNQISQFLTGNITPWGAYVDKGGYIYFASLSDSVCMIPGSAETENATQISLTMNTTLEGNAADPSAFTIGGVDSNPFVTSAKISGSTITLALNNPITSDETVTVSYAKTGTNDLTTQSDYKLDNFSGIGVINNLMPSPNLNQTAPTGLEGVAPTFAGGNGKITGTTTAMEFRPILADNNEYLPCSEGETTVTPSTYLVRLKAKTGYHAGYTTTVYVHNPDTQNQDAPIGLVGVAPTSLNGMGKITGTTTAMEFKLDSADDSSYSACSEGETMVNASATYSVRFSAKPTLFLNAGTPASVTVPPFVPKKSSSDDDSSGGGGNSTPISTTKPADKIVLINGKEEKAGTETKSTVNGVSQITLTVDSSAISKKLKEVLENKTDKSQNLIVFSLSSCNSGTVALTGDIVKELENSEFNISISKDQAEYIIPAEELAIRRLADILDVDSSQLKDIEIKITIKEVSAEVLAKYNEIAGKQEHELVVPPVEFEIVAKATGTDGVTRETTVSKFSNYVERIIEIPANFDPMKITTGVVFNADGTYSHVPTVVFEKDGKYYAKLSSLTNSAYSVIYNPITVDSVNGHWSEEIVNSMAARLILTDTTNFNADEAVTRAEFADYIVRSLGLYRESNAKARSFKDVSIGSKYQLSIEIAKEWGIISGYPNGDFKPDATITREEVMAMYANAMDIVKIADSDDNKLSQYSDNADVSKWATSHVERVVNAEIFNGKGNGLLTPKDTLTKGEALTAIRNLLLKSELINK